MVHLADLVCNFLLIFVPPIQLERTKEQLKEKEHMIHSHDAQLGRVKADLMKKEAELMSKVIFHFVQKSVMHTSHNFHLAQTMP